MNSFSPRHQLPASRDSFLALIEKNAQYLAHALDGDTWAGEWTAIYSKVAHNNACMRAYRDPSDPGILSALEICACTSAAAHCAVLTPDTTPIKVSAPGGRVVTLTRAKPPMELSSPAQWRQGVLAAVASRNQFALEQLTRLDIDSIGRLSTYNPPWFTAEARALAALLRHDADATARIDEALRIASSDTSEQLWPLDIVTPELEMALCILRGDGPQLSAAMTRALERHHHYYGETGKDHYHGQLALAPLAMACFAHDLGLVTTVDSDYAPRWIIERRQAR